MKFKKIHGMWRTRLYATWCSMKSRCYNKNNKSYKSYGGRGIQVCDEWMKFPAFQQWALATNYNDSLTIERADNNQHYTPANCSWIPLSHQSRNRRNVVRFKGEHAREASLRLGGNKALVSIRMYKGWSIEKAFTTPLGDLH